MNPGRKLTLEDENYTLYSSDTKIQKDGYSCGPIASEIARMLHSNYEKVENYLSTRNSNYNLVKLDDFLPREELDQLRESCSKEMTVRYGKDETKINAADYRAAHLMCGLIEKEDALLMTMIPFLEGIHSGFVQKSSQKRKQGAKEIRSFFIGKPDNVELFCQIINDLVCAIEKGHKGSVNDLIKAKANVNIQDGDNVSTSTSSTTPTGGLYGEFAPNTAGFQAAGDKYALHEAARRSDIEKVLNLIKIGYGVNAKDDDGWTPLHWAASEGYKEVVKKLINARADVNAKDDDGKTARDVTEDDDIKNLLEEAGKTDNTSPIISETEVENHNTSATPTTSSSTKTANKNTNTTFWSEHKGKVALGVVGLCIAGAVAAYVLAYPVVALALAASAAVILMVAGIAKVCEKESPKTNSSYTSVSGHFQHKECKLG